MASALSRPKAAGNREKQHSTDVSTWVSAKTKQRFGALADQLGLSESALLKRVVDLNLRSTGGRRVLASRGPVADLA